MMRLAAAALFVLGALAGTEVHAQVLLYRPGTAGRPWGPVYPGPYYGGYPYGGGPFGSGLFNRGTYAPPAGPSPTAPGYSGTVTTLGETGRTTISRQDGTTESITGHPTRFLYYGHYFLNQGGGTVTPPPLATIRPPETAILFGADYARAGAGMAPVRPQFSPRRR